MRLAVILFIFLKGVRLVFHRCFFVVTPISEPTLPNLMHFFDIRAGILLFDLLVKQCTMQASAAPEVTLSPKYDK